MKNVLKKRTAGEVQKSHRSPTAAAVTPRSDQRGSAGQFDWDGDSSGKLKDLGNVDGKASDRIPFCFTDGKECAAPSSFTTPQPPSFEMTPA
jgi:hypothetical protein